MRNVWLIISTQRDFRLMLSASLIALTGGWVLRVGLAYQVYVLTGSTLASATMLIASFLPQILLGSVAGVFVDRWDRRRTMIVSNLLLAVGLLPLFLVRDAGDVWLVYLVLLWNGCVQQFFAPAEQSMLPRLVADRQLVTANALNGQARDVARLVGSAIGGVAAAAGGLPLLTLINVATFLLAAMLIRAIRARDVDPPKVAEAAIRLGQRIAALRQEWTDGLRFAGHQRVLRVIMIFLLVTTVGEGVMGTLFAPFVRDAIGGTSQQYGLIVAVQAIGGLAGGVVAASLGDRIRPVRLLGWGAVAFGAIDLTMFLYPLWYPVVWPAVALMILVGLPGALAIAGAMTLLQRNSPDSHRGRVFGAVGAIEGVSLLVGAAAAGVLGDLVGTIPILAVQGAGYVGAGLWVILALRRTSGQLPTDQVSQATAG